MNRIDQSQASKLGTNAVRRTQYQVTYRVLGSRHCQKCEKQEEIFYGNVKIQLLAYQDGILKGRKNLLEAQVGNVKLTAMAKDKGLKAHLDKTCFIVYGTKKFKNKVAQDMERNSLRFSWTSFK